MKKKLLSFNKVGRNLFLFGLSFIALLFLSELFYTIKNKPSSLVPYNLALARIYSKMSNNQKSIMYLSKASSTKIKEVVNKYPGLTFKTSVAIPSLPDNQDLAQAYNNLLQNLNYNELEKTYPSKWAKPFYDLGLIAYKNNEPGLTIPFWERAVNLAPEWSYFHIELANFYLTQGKTDKARELIEFCLQFKFPEKHCREFLELNIKYETAMFVGYFEKQINDI